MKTFGRNQIGGIIRRVIRLGGDVTVQEHKTGNALSVFQDHTDDQKKIIVREFCDGHVGPYKVFSTRKK